MSYLHETVGLVVRPTDFTAFLLSEETPCVIAIIMQLIHTH